MTDLLLRDCRLRDRDGVVDIAIDGDRITTIGPSGIITGRADAPVGRADAPVGRADAPVARSIEVGGRLVTPGLVEAHIHLDKALLSGRVTASAGTAAEAIRITGHEKRRFSVEDIHERARALLEMAVAAGTTAMRTHVEVDPIVGLMGMEAILALREEFRPAIDLQICAFAQEGILQAPGTEGLLRRALSMGADLIGGCPYNDTDATRHIEIVFALAQAFGVDADFHVDFFDEPDHLHIIEIAEQTVRAGWQGRVAVGHLTELAALAEHEQDRIIADIAAAGIGVLCLPLTDLYLMGRADTFNVRRGLTPIRRLLAAGIPVALASNNIRNPFTPIGTADLADLTFVAAVAAHMGTPTEMRALVDCVTTHPARILRLADYGVATGARADLLVWECESSDDIVARHPPRACVVKNGRVTIETERHVRARWR